MAADNDLGLPPCSVAQVAERVEGSVAGSADVVVVGITHDSRQVQPGWLFVCVRGASVDGHEFVDAAISAGASAVLVERHIDVAVPQIIVSSTRLSMAAAAAEIYGNPSLKLKVIGVTGTNGKTSVVHLLADVLGHAGASVRTVGTLSGDRTTPESPDLQRQLAIWHRQGVEFVAMEVSSHALELHRVLATRFAAVVFTNLGRDHLDFHHDVESYFEAKAKLFTREYSDTAVINVDDEYGRQLMERIDAQPGIDAWPFGRSDISDVVLGGDKSTWSWRGHQISVPLVGSHNVINALAVVAVSTAIGLDPDAVIGGLASAGPIRGRFETVDSGQPFVVAVDYAHTADALEALLATGRELTTGELTIVFGCGGDRDRSKRPEMGRVALQGADRVIVTTDNPRTEDPSDIIEQILLGMNGEQRSRYEVEFDRRRAIKLALTDARQGDVVLIAGKGHETTQVIGSQTLEFDDVQVVREILANLKVNR